MKLTLQFRLPDMQQSIALFTVQHEATVLLATCRDGSSKLFQLPLPANKLTANQMRGVDIKSVLASTSAESAEVAALEEEMASELAKEAGTRGKGNAESSPEMNEAPSVTPAPSKRSDIDRYHNPDYVATAVCHPHCLIETDPIA